MLNLDKFNDTSDIQINGKIVSVNPLSVKMVKKLIALEKLDQDKVFDEQIKLITEILNNNTSAEKFRIQDVENLSVKALTAIIKFFMGTQEEIEKN